MNHVDVVCVGVMLIDLPLRLLNEDVFDRETTMVDDIQLITGGDALNEAVILSRLGNKVALIGHIGKDMFGDFLIKQCEENYIDHSNVIKDPHVSTRINVVLIKENGQRHFIKNMNGSSRSFHEEEINYETIKSAKVVSLASIFASKLRDNKVILKILKTAKENNVITFADMVPIQNGETIEFLSESLPYLDYFLPNLEEAEMLTGKKSPDDIADCLIDYGIKNVVIKMGEKGCFIKNRENRFVLPAIRAKTIDTTGAGDNFVAGFITGLLAGKDIEECGRYANAVAALSTESIGATTGVKNKKQIEVYQDQNR